MTRQDESNVHFLHGTLVIRVEEARDLPDLDRLQKLLKKINETIDLLALGGTAVRM